MVQGQVQVHVECKVGLPETWPTYARHVGVWHCDTRKLGLQFRGIALLSTCL